MDDLAVSSVRAVTDVLNEIDVKSVTVVMDKMDVLRHDGHMTMRQQLAALLGVHLLVLLALVAGAVAWA